jgi:hypothetical protein
MMNITLSKREKALIFILALLIVISIAYTFFFNPQLEKWNTQRGIYDGVQIMVDAMNQSDEELEVREKYIEGLKIEAEKLAVGYYLDYTNHMAEQKITALVSQEGLNPSFVSIEARSSEPFLPYGAGEDVGLSVNASRINVSFDTSGSLNTLISLLTKIDKDRGLRLSAFSMSGPLDGTLYMNVYLEMLLGSSQGVLDE